jgi:hypothetical protein
VLTGALAAVSTNPGSSFARTKYVLLLLWFGALLGSSSSLFAALGNAWPEWLSHGPWRHAGSNPRQFIPGIPATRKPTPWERMTSYLQSRRRTGKPSLVQSLDPPRTKKEALRDTATRYAQAIDENERNLTSANFSIALPLGTIALFSLLALIFIEQLSYQQPSPVQAPAASAPVTPSLPPPSAPASTAPDTPPNPTAPSTPGPRKPG